MHITVKQLVEASRKDGFPWARQNEARPALAKGILACVVGQGIANLIPDGDEWLAQFPFTDGTYDGDDLAHAFKSIYRYNDNEAKSYEDAFAFMEKTLAPFMDEEVTI